MELRSAAAELLRPGALPAAFAVLRDQQRTLTPGVPSQSASPLYAVPRGVQAQAPHLGDVSAVCYASIGVACVAAPLVLTVRRWQQRRRSWQRRGGPAPRTVLAAVSSEVVDDTEADADVEAGSGYIDSPVGWKCIPQCGACCYLAPDERPHIKDFLSAEEYEIYKGLVLPDGWCKNYDRDNRMCTIFDTRPSFCSVKNFLLPKAPGFGVDASDGPMLGAFCANCCRESIQDVYGEESAEMDRYDEAVPMGLSEVPPGFEDTLELRDGVCVLRPLISESGSQQADSGETMEFEWGDLVEAPEQEKGQEEDDDWGDVDEDEMAKEWEVETPSEQGLGAAAKTALAVGRRSWRVRANAPMVSFRPTPDFLRASASSSSSRRRLNRPTALAAAAADAHGSLHDNFGPDMADIGEFAAMAGLEEELTEEQLVTGRIMLWESLLARLGELPAGVGLEKKTSGIPNAGDGLFATRPFEAGDIVAIYGGTILSEENLDLVAAASQDMLLQTETGEYLDMGQDGEWSKINPIALAQFCNHPTGGRTANLMTATLPCLLSMVDPEDMENGRLLGEESELVLQSWTPVEIWAGTAPVVIALAIDDIEVGDELFFDYGLEADAAPEWYE
eukprot:TRINITY_DN11754_c0_g1_i1.p1 TRINITY_DN11754_c0_g1~~TRINITY_DN11754_c0_g1_i1.p1  ORF type:complete len:618 (+),score=111.42 TRINITY_DN11754_c0_g1_i1:62-1915(+)